MAQAIVTPPVSPVQINGKRVSFGDTPVKTFLYEQENDDVTPIITKQPFTDPSAPVERVQVTADETREVTPRPIPPPAQLDDIRKTAASPPLSWTNRKMESEHENPFRPQDDLYHEVDPIVEMYLQKPFPSSQPGSAHATPAKHNGHATQAQADGGTVSGNGEVLANGLGKEHGLQYEKMLQHQPLLASHDAKSSSRDPSVPLSGNGDVSDMPAPGQVELVHIKKKKCGCCSIQ